MFCLNFGIQSTLDITRSKGPKNFRVISRVLQDPRYIESYFKGFLVVGTEEFSRYIKSFTDVALYRESTVKPIFQSFLDQLFIFGKFDSNRNFWHNGF